MNRILVTGGAGFLGSRLCRRLQRRTRATEIVCLDNFSTGTHANVPAGVEVVRHDVRDPFRFAVDEIYHLACPASPVQYRRNPLATILTAIDGTRNALAAAREVGAKLLIASTSEVYGDPAVSPQPESYWGNVNPIGPRACYDEGKRAAEALAVAHVAEYGTKVAVARIFNTYGPGMQAGDGRVVSNFVVQALLGKPLTLYGDGQQTRSFCFVGDTVDGLIRLMARGIGAGPVNIGNPHETTIRELAEMVLELTGSGSKLESRELPVDDPTRRKPDVERAARLLGWEPTTQLRDGLWQTIQWFQHGTDTRWQDEARGDAPS